MIVFLNLWDFGGRLHPVLVHLPIGIMMLVCLYYIFTDAQTRLSQSRFISAALFWGMLSAIAACISGLLLANSGDYDAASVNPHQWSGIAVAVVSIICYFLHRKQFPFTKWVMIALVALITVAGHLGGSITHGDDYLTAAFESEGEAGKSSLKPIPDIQQAVVYSDIIKPILSDKCYSCHGPGKQKGKLRLDETAFILKGGKGGAGVVWNHTDQSIVIERILLPESDEDHMPPRKKPQLTKQEIDLLQWWVETGAGFDKKVHQLQISDKIKPTLLALQTGTLQEEAATAIIPEKEVKKADDKTIIALREKGVVVIPVASNSNYLSANFVSADTVNPALLNLLEPLKEQLIWLKIGFENIKDAELQSLGKLTALTRLHVEGNPITDAGLNHLKDLKELRYINLSKTNVSQNGVAQLQQLKNLEKIYLYGIAGSQFNIPALKKLMPKTLIDTGGYIVPTLVSDTTIVEAKKEM